MPQVPNLAMPSAVGLLTVSTVLLLVYGAATAVYNLFFHPLRRFPGPKLWAATSIPSALNTLHGLPHHKILSLHQQYGDIVRVGPNELALAHPEAWKEVYGHLKRGQEENPKDFRYITQASDKSLISASRERHGPMRRLLSHAFSARAMVDQQPLINKHVDLMIRRFHEHGNHGKQPIDAAKWFEWTTFDIIGDLAFGEPFGCLERSTSHPWVECFFASLSLLSIIHALAHMPFFAVLKPLYFVLFVPRDAARRRQLTQTFAEETLKKRRALGVERPDFVEAMLRKDAEYRVSDQELRDNSIVLTTAGSETTATTLAAATYFLGTHPQILAKVNDEVRGAFGSEEEININSVQNLPYMLAVLKEVMRIHPPVAISLPRMTPLGGAQIAGEYIAGGTTLGIWQYAVYHDPSKFLHPDSFIPERWLDDERFAGDVKELHQPFSYGPQNCLGMNLAYAEMRLILARIIWNFDLQLAPQSEDWAVNQKVFFFWDKPPLWTYFNPRKA